MRGRPGSRNSAPSARVQVEATIDTPLGGSDRELAERHRWGDAAAFDELWERHHGMVYNLAVRLVGIEEADDLTQDAFVRIYRHLGKFRGRSSLKTWVYRVALNCCRSRLRRRRPAPRSLDDEEAGPEPADGRSGPERRTLAREDVRRLLAAVGRLPTPYREAVVLRDLEELSYQEIAQVLGVRLGTVRSRIARGRDRLHALLEEDG